ncbi:hypothetical protein LOZ58_006899, partial [Ophidiomyces ophidiicola]
ITILAVLRRNKGFERRNRDVERKLNYACSQHNKTCSQALKSEQLLRQALENRVNATTFEQFLQSCHEHLSVPLALQPKKSKSTKGSITAPKGRYCPTTVREWSDFPHERDDLFGRVFHLLHPPESRPFLQEISRLKMYGFTTNKSLMASCVRDLIAAFYIDLLEGWKWLTMSLE